MGGSGSGRWGYHSRKIQVEECRKLSMHIIARNLRSGFYGWLKWTCGGRDDGQINYLVTGGDAPTAVRLLYTLSNRTNGEVTDYDYPVTLTTTLTPWNSTRYWFRCPLYSNGWGCNRRVAVLYLPPGGYYFGCRHCYDLTYRSCQEEHQFDSLYKLMAASMQDSHPGFTPEDVRFMLEYDPERRHYSPAFKRWLMLSAQDAQNYDFYPGYLSASELCTQSGLDPSDLTRLGAARLLLTDRPSGLYRPKLVGWARKLAYLLAHEWDMDEIKRWSKGRWATPNPKQWPPNRSHWMN